MAAADRGSRSFQRICDQIEPQMILAGTSNEAVDCGPKFLHPHLSGWLLFRENCHGAVAAQREHVYDGMRKAGVPEG
jgi:hypothetical protein